MKSQLPFDLAKIKEIISNHPTPFHLYDEKGIVENAKRLKDAFSFCPSFKEYFAVKALPTPHILKLLSKQGFGGDCSSLAELILCEKCGIVGEDIMFTSNDTSLEEFEKAKELGAIINLDDISHIPYLAQLGAFPELVCLRFNPGPERTGNAIIGNPSDAKFGFTREQLYEGYRELKEGGVKRFGLHAMIASNELTEDYFVQTANMLVDLVADIAEKVGIEFQFINIGGGIGIPYKPEDKPVDIYKIAEGCKAALASLKSKGFPSVSLSMECGRYITGPYGYLVSTVRHTKRTYKNYLGLDASMADLMRPGMYGAYHHITVLNKREGSSETWDVTGSLCENNDKFAVDRELSPVKPGDIVVIHDAGAHGRAMGFNYNGKMRAGELLMRESGETIEIRRRERLEDLFATLDFKSAEEFKA